MWLYGICFQYDITDSVLKGLLASGYSQRQESKIVNSEEKKAVEHSSLFIGVC